MCLWFWLRWDVCTKHWSNLFLLLGSVIFPTLYYLHPGETNRPGAVFSINSRAARPGHISLCLYRFMFQLWSHSFLCISDIRLTRNTKSGFLAAILVQTQLQIKHLCTIETSTRLSGEAARCWARTSGLWHNNRCWLAGLIPVAQRRVWQVFQLHYFCPWPLHIHPQASHWVFVTLAYRRRSLHNSIGKITNLMVA